MAQLVARAEVLAARDELELAETAAREAVRLSQLSDDITQRGDAFMQLGVVMNRAGHTTEADTALRVAIALHERKGNVVSATRAREHLARLSDEAGVADV